MNHSFLSHKSLLSVALSASLLAGMTSCQDEDFGYSADQIKYAKNFVDLYGEIPADKSWDLSSFAGWVDVCDNTSATRAGGGSSGPTRGPLEKDTHYLIATDYFQVKQNLLKWMNDQLKEGYDNRYLGSSFVLRIPDNDFAIIPIFQGSSSIMSELEVKINDYQITKVWTKSENVQAQRNGSSTWEDVKYFSGSETWDKVEAEKCSWPEGGSGLHHKGDHTAGEAYYRPKYPYHPASTIGDDAVRSKPILFKRDQILTARDMNSYFYLSLRNIAKQPEPQGIYGHGGWGKGDDGNDHWFQECYQFSGTWSDTEKNYLVTSPWDSNNTWTTVGDRLTSINPGGYMLALNVAPEALPSASDMRGVLGITDNTKVPQCIIVGCEDANGADSDHDNNDIVFLIVGYPNAPQIVPTTEVIRKRYMCEDLGGTDDFDFNDVVIDMTQTRKINIAYSGDVSENSFFNTGDDITSDSSVEIEGMTQSEEIVQTAKLVHVCGTLPLQVRVGDYFFPPITDPTNEYQTRTELKAAGYWKSEKNGHNIPTRGTVRENGWNPNEEKILTSDTRRQSGDALWNPNANNVKVYVDWTNWNDSGIKNSNEFKLSEEENLYVDFGQNMKVVSFPNPGQVPYIIATDQTTPWMAEREHIPNSWMRTGDFSTNHNDKNPETQKPIIQGPGSNTYYENYGTDISEAVLWKGSMKGAMNRTVVDLSSETSKAGIDEAKGKFFNILKVYTGGEVHVSGETYEKGRFSVCYKDGDEWKSIFDGTTNPDYFIQDQTTAGGHVNSIMISEADLTKLITKGMGIVSRTNGLEITKVTMYRVWDPTLNGGSGDYQKNVSGRILEILESDGGTVTLGDRTFGSSSAGQGGYQALYPYEVSAYSLNGTHDQLGYTSQVVLTAHAAKEHAFDKWSDGSTDNPRTLTIASGTGNQTIKAIFKGATDPEFKFKYRSGTETSMTVRSGQTYTISLSSKNTATSYKLGSYNTNYINVSCDQQKITINTLAPGETSFTIYQPEGNNYSGSDILTVKVKVYNVPENLPLSGDMFHEWDKIAWNAAITGAGDYIDKTGTPVSTVESDYFPEVVIGSRYNSYNNYCYADLNQSNYLVINMNTGAGVPHLWFNHHGTVPTCTDDINFPANSSDYSVTIENNDNTVTYLVDLKEVRSRNGGYSILSSITTESGEGKSTNIKSVYLDDYECPAEANLSNKYSVLVICKIDGTESYSLGEPTLTIASGTFYSKSGDTFVALNKTSVTGRQPVYVDPNTVVTLTVPQNNDYKFKWSNETTDYTRTLKVDGDGKKPEAQYTSKLNPNLQIGTTHLNLNNAHTSDDINWSSESPAKPSFSGYDYQNDVNIWLNSYTDGAKSGSFHVRAQKNHFENKVITVHQDATDDYKSADVTFTVSVSNYYDSNVGAYVMPVNNKSVSASAVNDIYGTGSWENYKGLPATIKFLVQRGSGVDNSSTLTIKNSSGTWTLNVLSANQVWADESASLGYENNQKGATHFWFTVSKEDWISYFANNSLVFDTSLGIELVFVQ